MHAQVTCKTLKKILIADDSIEMRRFWKVFLQYSNLNYHFVKNGKEASEKFLKENYDAVLLDIEMPEMDGYEAAIFIKSINPNCPMMAVSSKDSEEDLQKMYKVGFDSFMAKLIDLKAAMNRIYSLINN